MISARIGSAPPVAGFRFAGIRCGVKARGLDLALIASERPAAAAGVLTRSTAPGAPVLLCRQRLRGGRARAILANAGVANVGLGEAGLRDARAMAQAAAEAVGAPPGQVLVASTGVIGERLPLPRILAGIPRLARALDAAGLPRAARAVMTTDTVPKLAGLRFRVGARRYAVAGLAKGSGMIAPQMATMLAFLVTDADVSPPFLRALWRQVAEQTFNRVRVDGETSTSDAALVLANGAAGGPCLRGPRSPGARALRHALHAVAEALAREIARDGEGATKLVRVLVSGARSADEALRAGRRIADSPLVKTAIYGGDPNWGRILQTVGAAEVRLNLRRAELRLCGVPVFRHGAACGAAARAQAARRLRAAKEVEIAAALGAGRGRAQLWTCDLSPGYIRINAAYN